MGGIPVLVVALMGITYGWQSDGDGGVEYLVQLSPTELQELDRLGEITSAIDPAVAGHVSRIRIRVGSGPLPRQTPSQLGQRHAAGQQAVPLDDPSAMASDQTAVPMPEIRQQAQRGPIRSQVAAMMKPDPENGAAGPGFQFPPSLGANGGNPTTGIRSDLDQAGRDIVARGQNMVDNLSGRSTSSLGNAAANGGGNLQSGASQTGNARQVTLPPFTGTGFSGPTTTAGSTNFPSGPSTEPTVPRDQSWNDYAGRRTVGPTTETMPRPANTATNNGGNTNLAPGGTFGQIPPGMSFPPRDQSTDPYSGDRLPTTQQPMELDRQNPRISTALPAGQESLFNQQSGLYTGSASGYATSSLPNSDPRYREPQNEQNRLITDPSQAPDRRLTAAELDAGAWSIDRYGRLFDRNGRLIPALDPNNLTPDQRTTLSNPYNPRFPFEQPALNRTGTNGSTIGGVAPNNFDRPPYAQEPNRTRLPDLDPTSLTAAGQSASNNGAEGINTVSKTARNQFAAQPLFNGLLLMSLVANVYLMFWLKNLRLRFRELVAAKRVANSNVQAS